MNNTIKLKTYPEPPFDRREIFRYAGVIHTTPELENLLDECIKECSGILSYRVCFDEFPIKKNENELDLGFTATNSSSLIKHLCGCRSVIIFAATVGLQLDRLINKYSRLSPAKAVLLQALGAERVEALCDNFCDDIKKQIKSENMILLPRFSPGYGDLPLNIQKDIFTVLDCPRKIGLSLNESLLMSPTKSVTAIVGIRENQ